MDTFVGGAGADTVRLMNNTSRQFLTIDIASGVEQLDTNGFKLSGSLGDDVFDLSGIQQLTISRAGIRLLDGEDGYIGHAGADTVDGGAGNDVIAAGGGNDRLGGGAGADQLTGGEGRDSFVFSALPQNRLDIDLIVDFSATDDRILFDSRAFKALGRDGRLEKDAFVANASGKAQDREDRIIYETDTGRLFYDANGSGRGKSVLIAELEEGLALNANDFLVI
jgi:Ca2+-binding RTX toxin-like protein